MDKAKLNMAVVNKVIAFKMVEILRDNGMIDIRKYNVVERKRNQYSEYVVKKNKIYKGGS